MRGTSRDSQALRRCSARLGGAGGMPGAGGGADDGAELSSGEVSATCCCPTLRAAAKGIFIRRRNGEPGASSASAGGARLSEASAMARSASSGFNTGPLRLWPSTVFATSVAACLLNASNCGRRTRLRWLQSCHNLYFKNQPAETNYHACRSNFGSNSIPQARNSATMVTRQARPPFSNGPRRALPLLACPCASATQTFIGVDHGRCGEALARQGSFFGHCT